MARKVGIDHHYAAPKPLWAAAICAPVVFAAILMKYNYTNLWIGFPVMLFAVGSLIEIAKWIFAGIERAGYTRAMQDVRLLCIGEADFKEGYPADPHNLLAATIVTLMPGQF